MKMKYIPVLCLVLFESNSFAHEQIVHEAITFNAAQSAYDDSSAYHSFIDVISSDLSYAGNKGATNSMVKGSFDEDFKLDEDSVGGYRSLNHFYDPIHKVGGKAIGLTDPTLGAIGRNSFDWSSISNETGVDVGWPIGNIGTHNIWSWQNARGYEWLGLTATNQSDRQAALANMFRSVGQVMHLLEDTSQPQHVRNEQHLDQYWKMDLRSRSAIEEYGKKYVNDLNYAHDILGWRGLGFTKMEDFWDRHLYNGSSTALNNAENSGAQLGLAEWCNGNFIGQRATYAEFFNSTDPRHFPFPSLANTTQPNLQAGNLWGTAVHGNVTLANFKQGMRLYISKNGAGVPVTYHSALSYLIAQHPGKASGIPTLTIADNNVLSNYHNIFIPKAVVYSAGLLDYFFRGQLDITATLRADGKYSLNVTNTSGQDFKDGGFHLFYDTTAGVRTELTGANITSGYTGSLATNASCNIVFTPPGDADSYILVYQGTIGTSGGTALDPVDAGAALAAKKLKILRWRIDWPDSMNDLDLYLTDACGNLVYFEQTNSDCGATLDLDSFDGGANDRNFENVTVGNPVDGNYQVWVNYYDSNSLPGSVSATLKTFYGNEASPVSTESFTLTTPDYGVTLPTSVTGPATLPSWYVRKLITIHNGALTQY